MDGLKFYQYEMLCVYNLAAAGNTTWLEEIFYFKYHVLTERCSIFSHWYLCYVKFSANVKVLSVSFEKKEKKKNAAVNWWPAGENKRELKNDFEVKTK